MKNKKKLSIGNIKIQSFVTSLNKDQALKINGGSSDLEPIIPSWVESCSDECEHK